MAKHIVVVAGAWHGPIYMETVNKKLESLGYTIHTRQLPAVGASHPSQDLSDDIAAVQSLVDEAIGSEGNDVAVICHSWGGIVTSSALVGYGKADREKAGKKGGVTRVGYMTAFVLDVGVSLADTIPGGKPAWWWDIQDPFVYATEPAIFYNDLPEAEQKEWHSKLQSQALASLYAKAMGAAWKEIPISYLVCEDDRAIPVQGQEAMIENVKAQGVQVDVERFKSSHSPFLSMPDETVGWIAKVAGQS